MTPDQDLQLAVLSELLEERFGIHYGPNQLPQLQMRLERVLSQLQVHTLGQLTQLIRDGGAEVLTQVLGAITVGESYFFRLRAQFDALRDSVLPRLASSLPATTPLWVWSAGCAGGEEAYSLAIWVKEHAPALWPDRVRIVATDLSPFALRHAEAGRYREWSLRHVEPYWRQRYFSREGDEHVVDPSLRQVIQFESHNLVSGQLPKGIPAQRAHLILCRNVLIYFTHDVGAKVLALFQSALAPDAFLLLGHAESMTPLRSWRTEYHPGTYLYLPPAPAEVVAVSPPSPQPERVAAAPRSRSTRTETDQLSQISAVGGPAPGRDADRPVDRAAVSDQGRPAVAPPRAAARTPAELLRDARRAVNAGDVVQALQLLAEHVALHPASVEGYLLVGMLEEQQGQWRRAQAALKRVLYLDKDLILGHYLMAVVLERSGEREAARKRYQTVCRQLEKLDDSKALRFGEGLTAGRLRELALAQALELEAPLEEAASSA